MGQVHPLRAGFAGEDFFFEPPRAADIPRLALLAKDSSLDDSAWRSLIAARNVISAKTPEGEIVGACVANHYPLIYRGAEFHDLRAGLNVLCNRFKLADAGIAFGAMTAIAPGHDATELRSYLLRALLRTIGLRYHHLFCFCRKDNPLELHALEAEGWRCFQEEDENCYFILEVARALRELASRLAFNHLHLRDHSPKHELPLR
jgi:hypothetical protein